MRKNKVEDVFGTSKDDLFVFSQILCFLPFVLPVPEIIFAINLIIDRSEQPKKVTAQRRISKCKGTGVPKRSFPPKQESESRIFFKTVFVSLKESIKSK